jgi:hypothetical protein
MGPLQFNGQNELVIKPSPGSSADDFDFFAGSWTVLNRKLKTRLDNCNEWIEFEARSEMKKILNGLGNSDNFLCIVDGRPFEGMTLRLFNPLTRLWSIYWADSEHGVLDRPVTGSFHQRIGNFFTKDVFNNIPIIMAFRWDATDPANPIWSQAFSPDNGKTWEWNWYMYMNKVC